MYMQTDYTPTGNLDIDLDRLTGTDDGFLDEVHGVRDAYGRCGNSIIDG